MDNKPFRVLSWGSGLQSTTLAAMSALGEIEPLDLIITADTGWERQVTYDSRDWYIEWLRDRGMCVEVIQAGDIHELGSQGHTHVPFFSGSSGAPISRQCTREIKIRPLRRRMREIIGYDATKPPHPPAGSIELWLGITMDEWTRATHSDVKFIVKRHPFLEMRWERGVCELWLEKNGLPVPPKSACVCCPYRRAREWVDMRDNAPDEWAAAIRFDEDNRIPTLDGLKADELYLWRGLEPLNEIDLDSEAASEARKYATQLPMFACESGYCGI